MMLWRPEGGLHRLMASETDVITTVAAAGGNMILT